MEIEHCMASVRYKELLFILNDPENTRLVGGRSQEMYLKWNGAMTSLG